MRKLEIIKNVGSSWFSLGLNIAVGLFLSPFILHRLGDTAFGIWVLVFSVTGYYGLFDLGIRSSVIRYVAKFTAKDETENLIKLINTSLFSYTIIGIFTLVITLVASAFLESIFRIPPEYQSVARLIFIMVGASVALGFPLGVFSGILEGLQKFYVQNLTNVVSTLLRAALIVVALQHGYGLRSVAIITIVLPLIGAMVRAVIVLRILPLKFGWKYCDRSSFREMANYSSATFFIMVAYKLRYKTDEVVIGAFMSSAAITYFSIGDRLLDYASEGVSSLAQIFVPMSSQSDAKGDFVQLRKLLIAGNRGCAFIMFPIAVVLAILGKSVIEVWVGARYVSLSYPVLMTLLFPITFMLSQGASPRIVFGMAKHRTLAWITFLEATANLILSIFLVRYFGIVGDALGTAIPLTLTSLWFFPRFLCKLLGVKRRIFLLDAYSLPLLLCVPLAAALWAMQKWFIPHHFHELALQLLIAAGVYGAGLGWAVWSGRAWRVNESSVNAHVVAMVQSA